MKKYNSISNHYDKNFLDRISIKIIERDLNFHSIILATEKIDGCNISIQYVPKVGYKFFSRNQELDFENDKFYNFQEVIKRDKILEKLDELRQTEPYTNGFVIFGELFGGSYYGKSFGSPVQGRISYCPDNRILFFDIWVGDDESGYYLSFNEFEDICLKCLLPVVPVIAGKQTNTFLDSLDAILKNGTELRKTIIPRHLKLLADQKIIYDLPEYEIYEDKLHYAEGFIIRGYDFDLMISDYDRMIIKCKNEKFTEYNRNIQVKRDEIDLTEYINENRVHSAITKFSEDTNFGNIVEEVINDCIKDYQRDKTKILDKNELKQAKKKHSKEIFELIKRVKSEQKK